MEESTGTIERIDGILYAVDDYIDRKTPLGPEWANHEGKAIDIEYGQLVDDVRVSLL